MNKFKTAITTGLISAFPFLTFAQVNTVQPAPRGEGFRFETILRILATLINWLFTILLVLATFFIFYAAYLYLTAAGDAEKVKNASNQLIYAAVSIGVALVAQGIRFLVTQLVQG